MLSRIGLLYWSILRSTLRRCLINNFVLLKKGFYTIKLDYYNFKISVFDCEMYDIETVVMINAKNSPCQGVRIEKLN